MVQSYNSLLAQGSISMSSRPQSAHSRNRIDLTSSSSDVKVFANSLYDAGDILAGQPEPSTRGAPSPQPPPLSPLTASGSQKVQQQRIMAAQKRLERLQMGGLAQGNESIAVINVTSSRPGTAQAANLTDIPSASAHSTPAASMSPNGFVLQPPSSGSQRMQLVSSADQTVFSPEAASAVTGSSSSRPRQGVGSLSYNATQQALKYEASAVDSDEDLEVETLGEPMIRPGTATAQQTPAEGSSSGPAIKQPQTAIVDTSDMRRFLRQPAPHASLGAVLCCIERVKGKVGKAAMYRFHLELPNGGHQFLLSARKRVKTATSSYVISTSSDDISRHSSNYIAKLRSNFVGTVFSLYLVDQPSGNNTTIRRHSQDVSARQLPTNTAAGPLQAARRSLSKQQSSDRRTSAGGTSSHGKPDSGASSAWQAASNDAGKQEAAAVMYEYNVLGTRGPRRLSAAVPHIDEAGSLLWVPSGPQDSMMERLRLGGSAMNHLVVLKNKEPKWNPTLNAYCLNFNGRVTEASVKNFQLVTTNDPDAVVLQFGKVSESCFTCDFSWPLSPLQAFSICLSSFDHKLACE